MSLLNIVRDQASVSWLTTRQREAYDQIVMRATAYSPALLLGPTGSGKTLLGWLLRRELGVAHTANPANIPDAPGRPSLIVIDNADLAGGTARGVLGAAQLRGWTTAVLIARSIDPQGIPAVYVPGPSDDDRELCLANIPFPLAVAQSTNARNLWQAIRWAVSTEVIEES